jgi:hypothetical protein
MEAMVVVAVKLNVTGMEPVHGAGDPDEQTLTLPALCCPKLAVTLTDVFIETVQVGSVPEHVPPLQPRKAEPATGVAVRVTVLLE